jgi:hypothetical protein
MTVGGMVREDNVSAPLSVTFGLKADGETLPAASNKGLCEVALCCAG